MRLVLLWGLCLTFSGLTAQISHPKASPYSEIQQDVGLTKIKVAYSRPAVRGRTIFGDLVPYGRIWRVGANESTKFTTDSDITIMGKALPKGTYALYAFPDENVWEIVFHKNTSHWGDGRKAYKEEEDAFRVSVSPQNIPYTQENFLITLENIDHNSANMEWIWENTKITIPIKVPTEQLMLLEIERSIKNNPTAQSYYEAARYLQEQDRAYNTALNYLENAIRLGGDTYYFHRVKSLVQAALGDYEAAIISANLSLNLAQKEDKDEFVRMNKKNINAWKQILKKK